MSRQSPVLRRLIKVSAVALGAGLVVTACSPVKVGSAAIVGNERITIATLDTEVTNLSQTVKLYPGTVQLSQAQQTQQTLTWLIRFKINDELARQAGITVSTAQAQKALDEIYAAAKASAQAQGITNVTLDLILAANGIPPNLANEVGRYQAIDDQFAKQANGGQEPTSTSAQTATTAKLTKARCLAAKALNDPGQPAVRPAELQPGRGRRRAQHGDAAGRPGQGDVEVGADAGLLIVLATSPRVAPGLLSWPAWEALRSAAAVLAPAGHPLLPALDEAGIGYQVAERIPEPPAADGAVVWLPEPGDEPAGPAGGQAAARLGRPAGRAPARPGGDHGPAAGGVPLGCPADPPVAGPAPAGGAVRGARGARVRR